MRERMSSLDAMKAFAAFLVIYIHVPISGTVGDMLIPVTRVAVPFFLMVSGFFLWNPDAAILRSKTLRQMKYILALMIGSILLFFVWGIVKCVLFQTPISAYFHENFSIKALKDFLIFNITPPGRHLWYLGAYLYVLILFFAASKFHLVKAGYWLIPALLLTDLAIGKYGMVLFHRNFPNEFARNALFVGVPYFLLGHLFREQSEPIVKLGHKNWFLAGFCFFSLTSILEKWILLNYHLNARRDHYISTTLALICIFIYAMQNTKLFQNTLIEQVGREDSLIIYIIHPILITILSVIARKLGVAEMYGFFAPFAVFTASAAVSMLWRTVLKPYLRQIGSKRPVATEKD